MGERKGEKNARRRLQKIFGRPAGAESAYRCGGWSALLDPETIQQRLALNLNAESPDSLF